MFYSLDGFIANAPEVESFFWCWREIADKFVSLTRGVYRVYQTGRVGSGLRPLLRCRNKHRSWRVGVAATGLRLAWLWIWARSGETVGAARTAFLNDCTFPFEMTHTVQKSGTPLDMLEGTSEVLNLLSKKTLYYLNQFHSSSNALAMLCVCVSLFLVFLRACLFFFGRE